METRAELIAVIGERYRQAPRHERSRILNEFVATTGYHRKHAIRLLAPPEAAEPRRRVYPACYGEDVREALVVLWEASDRICGKRLRPLIPVLLPSLERHGRLHLADELRRKLLSISAATIDRLLAPVRQMARGGTARRAGFSSAVRRSVPVRTFADWNDPPPGYVEVDFVAHGGPSSAGSFIQTLVLTDVATGWTECIPALLRESGLVIAALEQALNLFPFPLRGVDFDNDSAFMNEPVVTWCRDRGLEVTRSRAYRKNDQAFVEQKNGALVRRNVGYARFEGIAAAHTLSRLYGALRLQTNLFLPSFKLRSKVRVGAKVIKSYHAPVPPAARVLAHPNVPETIKAHIEALIAEHDPVLLVAEIRAAQSELGQRMGRQGKESRPEAAQPIDIPAFARSLKTAWREGEQRPIHRRAYRRMKSVPRRPSMMDGVEDQVRAWLERSPAMPADTILQRLIETMPGTFTQRHLRTVQRAVKRWRGDLARTTLRVQLQPALPLSAGPDASGPAESHLRCDMNIVGNN